MDKTLIRRRFARSVRSYAEYARAQQMIAGRMCLMLRPLVRECPASVLEIGCGTGTFTRLFMQHFHPARMTLNDICPEVREALDDVLSLPGLEFLAGDAEQCRLPEGQELIISCSVLQWLEHPEDFIRHCRSLLVSGGTLAVSTFGPDNLREVKDITGSGLEYPSVHQLERMLSDAGLETLLLHDERIVLNFPSATDILRHLKHTGVTGIVRTQWTPGRLVDFSTEYSSRYGAGDGSVPLTYHPVYMIAKKD